MPPPPPRASPPSSPPGSASGTPPAPPPPRAPSPNDDPEALLPPAAAPPPRHERRLGSLADDDDDGDASGAPRPGAPPPRCPVARSTSPLDIDAALAALDSEPIWARAGEEDFPSELVEAACRGVEEEEDDPRGGGAGWTFRPRDAKPGDQHPMSHGSAASAQTHHVRGDDGDHRAGSAALEDAFRGGVPGASFVDDGAFAGGCFGFSAPPPPFTNAFDAFAFDAADADESARRRSRGAFHEFRHHPRGGSVYASRPTDSYATPPDAASTRPFGGGGGGGVFEEFAASSAARRGATRSAPSRGVRRARVSSRGHHRVVLRTTLTERFTDLLGVRGGPRRGAGAGEGAGEGASREGRRGFSGQRQGLQAKGLRRR